MHNKNTLKLRIQLYKYTLLCSNKYQGACSTSSQNLLSKLSENRLLIQQTHSRLLLIILKICLKLLYSKNSDIKTVEIQNIHKFIRKYIIIIIIKHKLFIFDSSFITAVPLHKNYIRKKHPATKKLFQIPLVESRIRPPLHSSSLPAVPSPAKDMVGWC